MLCRLRGKISGLSLPGLPDPDLSLTVSAYADDLNVFVSNQQDISNLQETLSLYAKASSARVNWEKREALLVGK